MATSAQRSCRGDRAEHAVPERRRRRRRRPASARRRCGSARGASTGAGDSTSVDGDLVAGQHAVLAATSAQVWHVADVNTATSHGASGRGKSSRSTCAARRRRAWVGDPAAAVPHGERHGDDADHDRGGDDDAGVTVGAIRRRHRPGPDAPLGPRLPRAATARRRPATSSDDQLVVEHAGSMSGIAIRPTGGERHDVQRRHRLAPGRLTAWTVTTASAASML